MSKVPKDKDHKDAPTTTFGPTVPGALYSNFGPIPEADVEEINSDSVWAMFENVPTIVAPLAQPPESPDGHGEGNRPDDVDPYGPTEMSPLR